MTKFKIGQKLRYINDVGGGVLKSIKSNGCLLIEDEEGFDYVVNPSDVLIVNEDLDEEMSGVSKKKKPAKIKFKPTTGKVKSKPKQSDCTIIDLHIEKIYPNYRQLDKWDILSRQLGYLKAQLQKVKSRHIKKVIIIHGVGEGTLRKEVHQLLNGMKNVQYHEASYVNFGQGATQVDFY